MTAADHLSAATDKMDGKVVAPETKVETTQTKETDKGTALLSLAPGEDFSPLGTGLARATTSRIGSVFSKKVWNVDLRLAPTFDAQPNEVKAAPAEYSEDAKVKGVVHDGVSPMWLWMNMRQKQALNPP